MTNMSRHETFCVLIMEVMIPVMSRRWQVVLIVCLAFTMFIAGGKIQVVQGSKKLTVVTTTNIIADAVRNVTGELADVVSLMGPGVDPHLYRASQGDIRTLASADVVFYHGLHLEGRMVDVFEIMARQKPTFAVTDYISRDDLLRAEGFVDMYDPHVWFDVELWIQVVERIRDALAQVDPVNEQSYRDNAGRYIEELRQLDQWVEDTIATIPPQRRILVTAHDAFGYFGYAYGVEVVGLQGISTDTEYGLADVTALVDLLVDREINAIFVETSVSSRGMEAVIAGARAQGHTVQIGGELHSDSLGSPGTDVGTFIGMVKHNVSVIAEALQVGDQK